MTSTGRRMTVEERMTMRDRQHVTYGREPGWPDYALDCYLSGDPIADILDLFCVSPKTFYNAISKAALYRLMIAANCQRMEDMEELQK